MRAVCRTSSFGVELRQIPVPDVTPEHVVIKVSACVINPGDKAWIAGLFPQIPVSMHDVCGASASGVVVDIGIGEGLITSLVIPRAARAATVGAKMVLPMRSVRVASSKGEGE